MLKQNACDNAPHSGHSSRRPLRRVVNSDIIESSSANPMRGSYAQHPNKFYTQLRAALKRTLVANGIVWDWLA